MAQTLSRETSHCRGFAPAFNATPFRCNASRRAGPGLPSPNGAARAALRARRSGDAASITRDQGASADDGLLVRTPDWAPVPDGLNPRRLSGVASATLAELREPTASADSSLWPLGVGSEERRAASPLRRARVALVEFRLPQDSLARASGGCGAAAINLHSASRLLTDAVGSGRRREWPKPLQQEPSRRNIFLFGPVACMRLVKGRAGHSIWLL